MLTLKMCDKQRNAPNVVLQRTAALPAKGNLLFQLTNNLFKLGNKHNSLLNHSKTRFLSHCQKI